MVVRGAQFVVVLTMAAAISAVSIPARAQNASPANPPSQAAPSQPASQASQPANQTSQSANQPANPKPINDLMAAAQRLRDATHDLAREKASEKRGAEITAIDKALLEVQSAMDALPPNLLLAGVKEKESKKAANEMARAAERLNDAAKALSNTNSKKTAISVQEIRKALAQIQEERTKLSASAQTQPNQPKS